MYCGASVSSDESISLSILVAGIMIGAAIGSPTEEKIDLSYCCIIVDVQKKYKDCNII